MSEQITVVVVVVVVGLSGWWDVAGVVVIVVVVVKDGDKLCECDVVVRSGLWVGGAGGVGTNGRGMGGTD